jgi:hypothetical protein
MDGVDKCLIIPLNRKMCNACSIVDYGISTLHQDIELLLFKNEDSVLFDQCISHT